MQIRNIRSDLMPGKVVRVRQKLDGTPYGTWPTSYQPNIGTYQYVLGYRGERLQPEWRSLHPVEMLKWEGTSVQSPLTMLRIGTVLYGQKGDIAANCFNRTGTRNYTTLWAQEDYRQYTPEVVLKGLASVKSPTFDGSTNLGELKETLSMIRNPLKGIRKLARELSKGYRKGRGIKLLDYLSSQWLEYRYGIMPLVGTVSDLLDTVDRKTEGGMIIYKGRARKRYVLSDETSLVSGWSDDFPIVYHARKRMIREVRPGSVFWARLNDTEQRRWGLRASDISSTVWELIPYSFMVDWVFNVGDYIRALTPNREIKILSCAVSCASSRKTSYVLTRMEHSSNVYAPASGRCDVVESFLQRSTSYHSCATNSQS